tara:strand:- start:127 stop:540 length:414 start_codon:yes stop_codon:yes gene_type:complete
MTKIIYICEGEKEGTARIGIDGEYIDSTNFRGVVDDDIHAIQWNGTSGEIEYKDGTGNTTISEISSYDFETRFTTEQQTIAQVKAQSEADIIANMTYKDKRVAEYLGIEDQLDEIYHNGIDVWKSRIKAIKDKYPKV